MKVLVIRFSSIGDIIMTTPVLRCLRQQLPECELHFATKEQYRDLISANPHVNKTHLLKDSLRALIGDLRTERFDVIVDLHNSMRSRWVRKRVRGRKLVVNKLNFRKWKMVRLKNIRGPLRHFSDRCLDAVAALGITNDGHGLEFFIPQEGHVDLNSLPATHRSGYVAIGIGARHNTKKLPVEKLVAICNTLHQPVILLGDKHDTPAAEEIVRMCGEKVLNACGRFDLGQTASLVEQARVVVSHDSAVMHLAAALRKPVVSIWGNTVPEFGMYPYLGQAGIAHPLSSIIEVKGLACRPCSKLGFDRCPKGHFKCMREIAEKTVSAAVNGFWQGL